MSKISTQVSPTNVPQRLTLQYFARQVVAFANRRGHSLESIVRVVTDEYNRQSTR